MSCIQLQLNKYMKFTPTFRYVKRELFKNYINIDHIAHRSFNYNELKDYYTSKNFTLKKDKYIFDKINVEATWLKADCFRIFLSQYKGDRNKYSINSFEDYKKIQKENDYVAWTLLHSHDINHVAIQVDDIEEIIYKIKQDGTILLNNELNPINVSRDGNLLQASTVADKISYKFPNGEIRIVPYTFVEFVQRIGGREGFETNNAAEIFKSTHL